MLGTPAKTNSSAETGAMTRTSLVADGAIKQIARFGPRERSHHAATRRVSMIQVGVRRR